MGISILTRKPETRRISDPMGVGTGVYFDSWVQLAPDPKFSLFFIVYKKLLRYKDDYFEQITCLMIYKCFVVDQYEKT